VANDSKSALFYEEEQFGFLISNQSINEFLGWFDYKNLSDHFLYEGKHVLEISGKFTQSLTAF